MEHIVEPVGIKPTTPGMQSQVAFLEHEAPHMLLEPWRIELHTPSLRRTNAALEHEAPSRKIQNVNLPVRSVALPCMEP